MKTFSLKKEDVSRKWFVVDAEDQIVGRLAGKIARVLRGKHSPDFTPHVDSGDFVVVINCDKVRLTGKKAENKKYYHHSGYIGGLKETSFEAMMDKHPDRVLSHAVKGMLPKNKLQSLMMKRLRVFAGKDHPYKSVKPEILN